MYNLTPKLSVVIISHNQREVLRRCIDSVLAQQTTFPVEVIVSDDRSTDGTREMLLSEYKDTIIPTFFNSDECNTTFTLERASYNRLNGLKYATGKYLINIDGDDFYTSTDLFQTMVDTLEAHPECSMCCQNYCMVCSTNVNVPHIPVNKSPLLKQNGIINGEELFSKVGYLHSSCFVVRQVKSFTGEDAHRIPYDDNTITARYLNDGKVAVVNRCDFVYVQYGQSTCATMTDDEKSLIFLPEFQMIKLAPMYTRTLMLRNLGAFSFIAKNALKKEPISPKIEAFFGNSDMFILNKYKNKKSISTRFRYCLVLGWTFIMFALHLKGSIACRILYSLAIGKIDNTVSFEH